MSFLPIVIRELRVAGRRASTYWQRAAAALGLILVGTWLYVVMQNQAPQQLAPYLFGTLTVGALFYSLLSGLRATADCLSVEKRDGTLGLLFLTDLKGYDVVLGKLAATSVNALYSVVAVVPILAIPLLMGGLTPGEFGRMAVVALNALFFSLALGMVASSVNRSAQKAVALTALLLLVFTALFPAINGLAIAFSKPRRSLFFLPSPVFAYYLAWDLPYRAQAHLFWFSVLTTHAIAWISLAVASVVTPRCWQDKPAGAQALRWRERWRSWTYGTPGERTRFRQQLLNQNAFFWLAARSRAKPAVVWVFLGLVVCAWVWGLARSRREWLNESVYVTTALVINFTLRVWYAGEATRQLSDERRAGTLELLLSTPLSVHDILRGQFLALARQFLKPVLVVLGIECLFMWDSLSSAWMTAEDRLFSILLWVAGMVMFSADLAAIYWVGMWQGLTARNPTRATTVTVSRILVLPWVAYALLVLLLVLVSAGGYQYQLSSRFYLATWFGLGLAADVGFAMHARHNLLTSFRLAAQEPYATSPIFRWLGLTYGKLTRPNIESSRFSRR